MCVSSVLIDSSRASKYLLTRFEKSRCCCVASPMVLRYPSRSRGAQAIAVFPSVTPPGGSLFLVQAPSPGGTTRKRGGIFISSFTTQQGDVPRGGVRKYHPPDKSRSLYAPWTRSTSNSSSSGKGRSKVRGVVWTIGYGSSERETFHDAGSDST